MLKAILQTWHDDGVVMFNGEEFPVTYSIEARGNANVREASGTVTGLSAGDSHRMLTAQAAMQLRLASGEAVDIAFLGGPVGGPARIVINSKMPGVR